MIVGKWNIVKKIWSHCSKIWDLASLICLLGEIFGSYSVENTIPINWFSFYLNSGYEVPYCTFSYPYRVEKVLYLGEVFEMEILMDKHVLRFLESKKYIFSDWCMHSYQLFRFFIFLFRHSKKISWRKRIYHKAILENREVPRITICP